MGNVVAPRHRDSRMSQAEPKNETVTLQRTGQQPLQFSGHVVAEVADKPADWVKVNDTRRWHELRLYQTAKGKYVLLIGFRTQMETEIQRDTVVICDDLAAVQKELTNEKEGYNPLEFVEGFPDRPQFADRQQRLVKRVIDDWDRRVGELLGKAGTVETLE